MVRLSVYYQAAVFIYLFIYVKIFFWGGGHDCEGGGRDRVGGAWGRLTWFEFLWLVLHHTRSFFFFCAFVFYFLSISPPRLTHDHPVKFFTAEITQHLNGYYLWKTNRGWWARIQDSLSQKHKRRSKIKCSTWYRKLSTWRIYLVHLFPLYVQKGKPWLLLYNV